MTKTKTKSKSRRCNCQVEPDEAAKMAEQASFEALVAAANLIRIGRTLRAVAAGDLVLTEHRRAQVSNVWAESLGEIDRARRLMLAITGAMLPPNHAERCNG